MKNCLYINERNDSHNEKNYLACDLLNEIKLDIVQLNVVQKYMDVAIVSSVKNLKRKSPTLYPHET